MIGVQQMRRKRVLLTVAIASTVVGLTVASAAAVSARRTAYPADAKLRMNQLQLLGTHNSYHVRPARELQPNEPADFEHAPLDTQLSDQGIRSLELDVYNSEALPVFHSIIVDSASNCADLPTCLGTIAKWSGANPGHVPIVVFVEPKALPANANPAIQNIINTEVAKEGLADWDATALERLDRTVRTIFRKQLITPDEVRGKRPTLRAAIVKPGWPTLAKTRGRVLVVLNASGALRDAYLAGRPSLQGRAMFVKAAKGDEPYAAVVDRDVPDAAAIRQLVEQGLIVKTRADVNAVEARANDRTRANTAIESGAQIVTTDYPEPDPKIGPYLVRLPSTTLARCNPVTAPRTCRDRDVENTAGLRGRGL